MRVLFLNLAWAFGALSAGCLLLVLTLGILWDTPDCGEDSPGVAYARSLSQERLEKLYWDMERLSTQGGRASIGWDLKIGDGEVPTEFSDLSVRKIRPAQGNIMVEGCFDHHIYLTFHGVGPNSAGEEDRKIELKWGEHPPHAGTQIIWRDS